MLTLTPKLHEDAAKKENGRTIYLMIIDEKILNKMQSNVRQKHFTKVQLDSFKIINYALFKRCRDDSVFKNQ